MVKKIDSSRKESQQKKKFLKSEYQHLFAIIILFLSIVIFFSEIIFEDKTFIASDTIAGKSFETFVKDAEQQGIFPLWNPYIFCGMPAYAALSVFGPRNFDISDFLFNHIRNFFTLIFLNNCEIGYIFFYYLLLGIGIYWLVYKKLNNKIAAFISALAVTHSTAYVVFIMIAHMTKVPVICFFPFIILVLQELEKKFKLWLALLLTLIIHFMFKPSHLQIIFYVYLTLGIYYLFFIIRSLIRKESIIGLIRSGVTFTIASALAFGMTADQYLQTQEYSKYSIRGTSPILERKEGTETSSIAEGGLDYNYATNWSFSPSEVITFFIPSAYGFGWHHYKGPLTQDQSIRINTYFGNQPFVDSPQYMGIVILLLGILGFWKYRKDAFVQFMGITIIIALLISFGREFPLIYNLMFYYFPMFNKFRAPVMILILVQFFIPILAGYGIHWLMNITSSLTETRRRVWLRIASITGVLAILSFPARDLFINIYQIFVPEHTATRALLRSYGNNSTVVNELYKLVTQMVALDISLGLIYITVLIVIFILFWKKKITPAILVSSLTILVIVDLWRINNKPKEIYPKQKLNETFATPDYIRFLQKSDTTLYRVLEFENGQVPYNNALAYWRIQNAYGYHGAKMRQIQDAFDVVGLGNPLLWGLMNVKYIITNRPDSSQLLPLIFKGQRFILYNRAHLPRAFFVNRYEVAKALDILNNIKEMNFDPRDIAFMMEDPKTNIEPPKENSDVKFLHYGIQDLELSVKASGNNLLFLSESWYPAGWKAFIDGKEVPIYRLNYMFRGIIVPPGQHELTMKFEPKTFYIGKAISLITNIVVLGGLLSYAILWISKRKKQIETIKP